MKVFYLAQENFGCVVYANNENDAFEKIKCQRKELLETLGLPLDITQWGIEEFTPDLYDGVLFSASVKYIKPQPKIYEIFFEKFNLKPETCFFVDDRKDNITGANNCGMDGYVFDGDVAKLKAFIYKNEGWTNE